MFSQRVKVFYSKLKISTIKSGWTEDWNWLNDKKRENYCCFRKGIASRILNLNKICKKTLRRVSWNRLDIRRRRGGIYFAINRVAFNVGWDCSIPTERWHPLFLFPAGCILASEASPNRITMTRLYTRQGNRAALWIPTTQIGCRPDWKLGMPALSVLYVKYFLCHRSSEDICSLWTARDVDYVTVLKNILSNGSIVREETSYWYKRIAEKGFLFQIKHS